MSQTFSPRELGPDAWKTWHKDAARLMGRLGWSWTLLWCAGLPLLGYGVYSSTHESLVYILCLWGMQVLGVLCQPLLQNVMDRAANGASAPMIAVLSETFTEVRNNPKWFRGRVLGQLVALVCMMTFMVTFYLLASSADPGGGPERAPNPYSGPANLIVFMVFVPIMLRNGGVLSFHYWLCVRKGASAELSNKLQSLALVLNNRSMFLSVLSLVIVFFLVCSTSLLALFLLPALHWYHAAFTRCAYHDIFEGGSGIKDKVAQTATALKPVLQA